MSRRTTLVPMNMKSIALFGVCAVAALSALPAGVGLDRRVQSPRGEPPQPSRKRVNVAQFGANPADDEYDDTLAVNAAIKVAGDNTTLHFPAGTYNVRWVDRIVGFDGLSLQGDGSGKSILKRMGPYWKPGDAHTWDNLQANYSTDAKLLRIEDCRNMCIRDLGFDAGGTPTFGGVGIVRAQRLHIAATHYFDSKKQPPLFGKDRFAWVVLGHEKGTTDIWFADNVVEGLQTEINSASRVLVERSVFKGSVKSAGLGFLSGNFSKPGEFVQGFHNTGITVRRNYFTNSDNLSMGMVTFQLDPPTNCRCRFQDIAIVDNVFVYDADSSTGHCAIKLGAGDNSLKTAGNVFERFRIEGNRIYRSPKLTINERSPAYSWFNARRGEERLNHASVRGNRLFADMGARPLLLIQRSDGGN